MAQAQLILAMAMFEVGITRDLPLFMYCHCQKLFVYSASCCSEIIDGTPDVDELIIYLGHITEVGERLASMYRERGEVTKANDIMATVQGLTQLGWSLDDVDDEEWHTGPRTLN